METRNGIAFLPGIAGERALVARLVDGDEQAYRECYELHAPQVMRVLVRLLRNRAVAEEILQETFASAFRTIRDFRGETRLSTWLAGIASRRGLNAIRGESRRLKNLPPAEEGGASPEPWLAGRDMTRKVLALLGEMEEPKRLALLLQAEGYTAQEIADISGEPRGTILSRLARGRAELAERAAAAGLAHSLTWLDGEGRS